MRTDDALRAAGAVTPPGAAAANAIVAFVETVVAGTVRVELNT
jgi:hypothetical protein